VLKFSDPRSQFPHLRSHCASTSLYILDTFWLPGCAPTCVSFKSRCVLGLLFCFSFRWVSVTIKIGCPEIGLLTTVIGSYSFVVTNTKGVENSGYVYVTQHAATASPAKGKGVLLTWKYL